MTKQKIRQIVLMLLMVCSVFNCTFFAQAQTDNNDMISPYYTNINRYDGKLSISGIKATCRANLSTNKSMYLSIKMELQKKKSDGYETVKTWTSSTTGVSLSVNESRNINVLCDYRLKITFTAGNETSTIYRYS